MKKTLSRWVPLLLLWGFFSNVQAQTPGIDVDLSLINPNAAIFTVGDLDLTNTGTMPPIFTIRITSNLTTPIRIRLELNVLANGQPIISRVESDAFELPAGHVINTNNQMLSLGIVVPDAQGNPQNLELRIREKDINYDLIDNLENAILNTGFLPAGEYVFQLRVINADTGEEYNDIEDNHTLFISNPTSIELQFPGNVISEENIVEINTLFPYFQYYSDAILGSISYNVYVYEKLPEDRTAQDVLSHTPILEINGIRENYFQYPTSTVPEFTSGTVSGAVRLLENGKTYYWLAESVIPTSTTPIVLRSEVFRFRVASEVQNVSYGPQIVAILRQLLGPDYEGAMQALLESGFEPNGSLTLDGSSVEINQLLQLLSQFQNGKIKLQKVEVY